jgi:hypothetical protein
MSDIIPKRNIALNRLLAEFDRPPQVPPKDGHHGIALAKSGIAETMATPGLPNNLWACLGAKVDEAEHGGPSKTATTMRILADVQHFNVNTTSISSQKPSVEQQQVQVQTRAVSGQRKRVAFAQDDATELSPPPVSRQKESFADQLGTFELNASTSVFDPPPAPRFSRFPEQLPDVPKRKPAPLNLNRPTSQTGKWKVRTESEIWTPIDDEPDTASIRSMDCRNAPRICPLPYKPIKSIPLRSRGSLRPAPLRIRKGVRFDSIKSPANLPLKSPALFGKKVRFGGAKSPAVPTFRTPSTPFSSAQFTVLTPNRGARVRFATAKSPATSTFKTPPTPFYQSRFRLSAPKRNVRFNNIKSPATSTFKTPPTPYYNDTFDSQDPELAVRFADVMSPAVPLFRTPATPHSKVSFQESPSPPDQSPITPRAMHMSIPAIEPESPLQYSQTHAFQALTLEGHSTSKLSHNGVRSVSKENAVMLPPRTTSLPTHRRNLSLPHNIAAHEKEATATLPATTFDESAVGESTLRWLGMLPKPSYRISNQNNVSDRNQILGSYFHKSTPSA